MSQGGYVRTDSIYIYRIVGSKPPSWLSFGLCPYPTLPGNVIIPYILKCLEPGGGTRVVKHALVREVHTRKQTSLGAKYLELLTECCKGSG